MTYITIKGSIRISTVGLLNWRRKATCSTNIINTIINWATFIAAAYDILSVLKKSKWVKVKKDVHCNRVDYLQFHSLDMEEELKCSHQLHNRFQDHNIIHSNMFDYLGNIQSHSTSIPRRSTMC
jgi:hypothetical protein